MRQTGAFILIAVLMASCVRGPEPGTSIAVQPPKKEVFDLTGHTPISAVIEIEEIGLHPATGAGLISQVKAKVIRVLAGSLPPCKRITFTIATQDANLYTAGTRYILTKDMGKNAYENRLRLEKPNKTN